MKLFNITHILLSMCFVEMSYAWDLNIYDLNHPMQRLIATFDVRDDTPVLEVKKLLKKALGGTPVEYQDLFYYEGDELIQLNDEARMFLVKDTGEVYFAFKNIPSKSASKHRAE